MKYSGFNREFGVEVRPYIEPDNSLQFLTEKTPFDNPLHPREREIEDYFFLGSTTMEDCPPRVLYAYAMEKNKEIATRFGRYLELVKSSPLEVESIVEKIRFPALEKPARWLKASDDLMYANYQETLTEFQRMKIVKEGVPLNSYSAINALLIPTLKVYKSIHEKDSRFDSANATQDDYRAWKKYLLAHNESAKHFFSLPLSAYLNIEAFKKHGYLTGKSGSGKSEWIKIFVHHLITRMMPKSPLVGGVVIDPHGDLAKEIAQFKECYDNDRVLYLDAGLFTHLSWSLNIFKASSLTEEDKELYAEYLSTAFEEIIADSNISGQMKTLLKPCLCVLLNRPKSGLEDLQRFMLSDENEDLVELGTKLQNRGQADFFKTAFQGEQYETTKKALYTRIQSLRNSRQFYRIVNKAGTLDIEKELESGKLLLFNLSVGALGEDVSSAIGRLILSQIKSAGYRRQRLSKSKRPSSYIIVDECHHYIGMSIEQVLTDLRKYGIHLILASQVVGYRMSTELVNAVLSCTAVKIIGLNANKTYSIMEKEIGVKREELNTLKMGKFCIHVKDSNKHTKPFFFTTPTYCLDNRNHMGKEKWKKQLDFKWKGYVKNSLLEAKEIEEKTTISDCLNTTPDSSSVTPKFDL